MPVTPFFNSQLTSFSDISADLTYLNFVVGVLVMFCFIPVQTWFYARDRRMHGGNRPEARFLVSLVTVWLFPITLLWFAFTSNGKTSYWSPVVAGGVLGFADPLLWLSMLNYITGKLVPFSSNYQLTAQIPIPMSLPRPSQRFSSHPSSWPQHSPISASSCSTTCPQPGLWQPSASSPSAFAL